MKKSTEMFIIESIKMIFFIKKINYNHMLDNSLLIFLKINGEWSTTPLEA